MNESQKPNDILVATISNPNASISDLLQNQINAGNTQLLDPESYKQSKFVLKAFAAEDGTFDNSKFEEFYKAAAEKYNELNDENMLDNLTKELMFSPTGAYGDISRLQTKESLGPVYSKLRNPLEQEIGHEDFNYASAATKTPEELAQNNRIFDPKTGKFIDKTPESLSLADKMFGRTLVYAKWEEDGLDEFGNMHYRGDWKTDENGRFYTEFIDNKDLKDKQVVALGDILTKEGSAMNKVDFFDSDGYTKSITGTAMKTMVQLAPYMIPGVNNVWGGLTALWMVGKSLPTMTKAAGAIFGLDEDDSAYKTLTTIENWGRKFTTSQSYEGRDGFFNFEQLANLVGDTAAQLYQQRAAASLVKVFNKMDKAKTIAEAQRMNDMGVRLSLGYMAFTLGADMYNAALSSGYDTRTAGFAAIGSMTAAYKIMRFNDSKTGIGSWFLDKTTGYDPNVSRFAIRKKVLPLFDEIAGDVNKAITTRDKTWMQNAKMKMRRGFLELTGRSEDYWKAFLNEAAEETSEEIINDTVKGLIDTASWLGWTKKEGSFGGWSNVFSKEGAERYLGTFIGGGIGGTLFQLQHKYELHLDPEYKEDEKDLKDLIISGKGELVKDEIRAIGKILDDKKTLATVKIGNTAVNITDTQGKTETQAVVDAAIERVSQLQEAYRDTLKYIGIDDLKQIAKLDDDWAYYSEYHDSVDNLDDFTWALLNATGGNKMVDQVDLVAESLKSDFADKMGEVATLKQKLNELETAETKDNEAIANAKKELEDKLKESQEFWNGDKTMYYKLKHNIWRHEQLKIGLFSDMSNPDLFDPQQKENVARMVGSKDIYAKIVYGKDYSEEDAPFKKMVDDEFAALKKREADGIDKAGFDKTLDIITRAYLKYQQVVGPILKDGEGSGIASIVEQDFMSRLTEDFYSNLGSDDLTEFQDNDEFVVSEEFLNPDGTVKDEALDENGEVKEEALYKPYGYAITKRQWRREQMLKRLRKVANKLYDINPNNFSFTFDTKKEIAEKLLSKGVINLSFSENLSTEDKNDIEKCISNLIDFLLNHTYNAGPITDEVIEKIIDEVRDIIVSGSRFNSFAHKILDILLKNGKPNVYGVIEKVKLDITTDINALGNTKSLRDEFYHQLFQETTKSVVDFMDSLPEISPFLYEKITDFKRSIEKYLLSIERPSYSLLGLTNEEALEVFKLFRGDVNKFDENVARANLKPELSAKIDQLVASGRISEYRDEIIEMIDVMAANLSRNADMASETDIEEDDLAGFGSNFLFEEYVKLLDKDEEFKNKLSHKANPVLESLKKILSVQTKQFADGTQKKYYDVLQYLNDTKDIITGARSLEELGLTDSDINVIIPNIRRAFMTLQSILESGRRTQDGSSLNEMMQSFIQAYPKATNYKEEYFQTYDDDYLDSMHHEIHMLDERLTRITNFVESGTESKIERERITRKKVAKGVHSFLTGFTSTHKHIGTVVLPDIEDLEESNPWGIIQKYFATVHMALKPLNKQQKEEFLTELAKALDTDYFGGIYSNYFKTSDLENPDKMSLSFILMLFAAACEYQPEEFSIRYREQLAKNPHVAYSFGQELAFGLGYAEHVDKNGIMSFVTKLMYDSRPDDNNDVNELKYGQAGYADGVTIGLMGAAGVGKSSVLERFILNAIRDYEDDGQGKWMAAATTQKKQEDIARSLGFTTERSVGFYDENGLFETAFSQHSRSILNEAHTKFEQLFGDTVQKLADNAIAEGDTGDTLREYESEEIQLTADGKVSMKVKIRALVENGSVSIQLYPIDFKFANGLLDIDDTFYGTRVIVDEATLCDPLTLHLLNSIGSSSTTGNDNNIRVHLLGDELQNGYELKINNGQLYFTLAANTNLFYYKRSTYLLGSFRSENNLNTENLDTIKKSARYPVKEKKPRLDANGNPERDANGNIIYDYREFIRDIVDPIYDIKADDARIEFERYWEAENNFGSLEHKLKYCLDPQSRLHGGHQIVHEQDAIANSLVQLQLRLEPGEKISILVQDSAEIDSIKQELADVGVLATNVDFFVEGDNVNGIQGSEANNVVIWGLTPAGSNHENVDTDYKRIYTYASRAKKFTLIVEPQGSGNLFTSYGITSVEDKNIFEDVINEAAISRANEDAQQMHADLINKLQSIPGYTVFDINTAPKAAPFTYASGSSNPPSPNTSPSAAAAPQPAPAPAPAPQPASPPAPQPAPAPAPAPQPAPAPAPAPQPAPAPAPAPQPAPPPAPAKPTGPQQVVKNAEIEVNVAGLGKRKARVVNPDAKSNELFAVLVDEALSDGSLDYSEFVPYATVLGIGIMDKVIDPNTHEYNWDQMLANVKGQAKRSQKENLLSFLELRGVNIETLTVNELRAQIDVFCKLKRDLITNGDWAANFGSTKMDLKILRYNQQHKMICYNLTHDRHDIEGTEYDSYLCAILTGDITIGGVTYNIPDNKPLKICLGRYTTYDGIAGAATDNTTNEQVVNNPKHVFTSHYVNDINHVKNANYDTLAFSDKDNRVGIMEANQNGTWPKAVRERIAKLLKQTNVINKQRSEVTDDDVDDFLNKHYFINKKGRKQVFPISDFTGLRLIDIEESYYAGGEEHPFYMGVLGDTDGRLDLRLLQEFGIEIPNTSKMYYWIGNSDENWSSFWNWYQSTLSNAANVTDKEKLAIRKMFHTNVMWTVINRDGRNIPIACYIKADALQTKPVDTGKEAKKMFPNPKDAISLLYDTLVPRDKRENKRYNEIVALWYLPAYKKEKQKVVSGWHNDNFDADKNTEAFNQLEAIDKLIRYWVEKLRQNGEITDEIANLVTGNNGLLDLIKNYYEQTSKNNVLQVHNTKKLLGTTYLKFAEAVNLLNSKTARRMKAYFSPKVMESKLVSGNASIMNTINLSSDLFFVKKMVEEPRYLMTRMKPYKPDKLNLPSGNSSNQQKKPAPVSTNAPSSGSGNSAAPGGNNAPPQTRPVKPNVIPPVNIPPVLAGSTGTGLSYEDLVNSILSRIDRDSADYNEKLLGKLITENIPHDEQRKEATRIANQILEKTGMTDEDKEEVLEEIISYCIPF